MPATTRPPSVSQPFMIADSTRQRASRRCSGRREHVLELPGGVHCAIASRERLPSWCSRPHPVSVRASVWAACSSELDGSVGQGSHPERYAPRRAIVLSAPTVTPSPSTAPPSMRVPSPTRQPAATMQSRSVQSSPISAPPRITERSTVEPAPTARSGRAPPGCRHARQGRRSRRARSPPAGSPGRGSLRRRRWRASSRQGARARRFARCPR